MRQAILVIARLLFGLIMSNTVIAQETSVARSHLAAAASDSESSVVRETLRDVGRPAVYDIQWNKETNHWHVTATFGADGKGSAEGGLTFQENASSVIEKDDGYAEVSLLSTDPGQNSRVLTIIKVRLLFSDRVGVQPAWFRKSGQVTVNWCAVSGARCSGWGATQ